MTDGRLSRESVEALLNLPAPAGRLSRESVEALLNLPAPAGRLSRLSVEVLVRRQTEFVGWGIPL